MDIAKNSLGNYPGLKVPNPITYGDIKRFVHFLGLLAATLFFASQSVTAVAQTNSTRIVAFGDSLTAGYLLPANFAFPSVLERKLRASGFDVEVINAGVSGDTSYDGLERLNWALGEHADGLILELGANDMLRGLNPDVTYQALTKIVAQSMQKGTKVLIAGMRAAPGMGRDYEERFNSIFSRIAREQNVLFYPFFLDGVIGNSDLLMQDGLHPTPAGVEKIVSGILPMVQQLIASLSDR